MVARPLLAKAWPWLATLALLLLAWRVLGLGLADHWAGSDPSRALAWRAGHPEALLAKAEQEVGRDPETAATLARAAAAASPEDGRPYRVLGEIADLRGRQDQALAAYRIAAERSPRDMRSQAWMADHYLLDRDAKSALRHVDRMLRVSPGYFSRLREPLVLLAAEPAAHDALAESLAASPPWRQQLVMAVASKGAPLERVAPLFERLRKAPGGLAPREMEAWVGRLFREGLAGQAYLTWANQLPAERLQGLGNLYNGGFEWSPETGGFDWDFMAVRGARIARLSGSGVSGRHGLRVAFEDRRVPFRHVKQRLALPPGHYRLVGRAKPDGLRTQVGLVWTVSCDRGRRDLGETAPLKGLGPWRHFEAEFTVPAGDPGCAGQWLTLRLPARIAAEQRIGGQAWFDDLKIIRLP